MTDRGRDGHDGGRDGRGEYREHGRPKGTGRPGHHGPGRPRGDGPEPGATETVDLHVALGHLPDVRQFQLHTGGGRRIRLCPHTRDTLAAHARRNRALGLLEGPARARFTHYVESVELPTDRVTVLRVSYPGEASVPELALMAAHVPGWALRAARERGLQRDARGVPITLAVVGVTRAVAPEQELAAAADADRLLTTLRSAATLVSMHPQLATVDPTTAATVLTGHILTADNRANIQRFDGVINSQGKNWATTTTSTDTAGNALTWGPAFPATAGQPVQYNRLSDRTVAAAGPAMKLPLTTSQQDPLLRDACWSVNQGTGSVSHVGPAAARAQRAGRAAAKAAIRAATADDGGYAFTLDNLTPGPGLDVDDSTITFTPDPTTRGAGTITVNVSNNFLRTLYAWAQFLDDHGQVVPVTDGGGTPSDYLGIQVVASCDVILGIPVPSEPTALEFTWPATAAKARLLHGGLGTSRWDGTLALPGAILTGVFNMAVPGLFLVAGVALDNNAWFKTLSEDRPLVAQLVGLALGVLGAETGGIPAIPDVEAFFVAMADAVAGMLVHKGLEKLQEYVVEKLGEAAMQDSIPAVNVFFQIANRAVDLVEIGETTVEVLTSPAVYEVTVVRTLDVAVVVGPDPTHGTSTQPPIWPTIATTWEAIVQYRGGTAHTQTGSMTDLPAGRPVTAAFSTLPAGGSIQVKFNVYAESGFLCGQYTSAWQTAAVPAGADELTVTGSIQENLVPLAATTQYQYTQKLVYDRAADAHVWQPAEFTLDPSAATSLDAKEISPAIATAFGQHGIALGPGAYVEVADPTRAWTVIDGPAAYRIVLSQRTAGGAPVTVLAVTTDNAPTAVVTDLDADNTGHNLATLVDITLNDKAYMLGYCWRASGQDIPETGDPFPVATQIHAFQNVSVLGSPEASLKFSPSGFDDQPAILYDQFGPAPLFSVPASYDTGLDAGGPVAADLAALFATLGHPLPAGAVAVVVTAGAAWTVGPPNAPAYALARVADLVEVHPYPMATVGQRNFYAQPTDGGYQLRQVTLDDTTPFDMAQTQSWGVFGLPFLDAFVVHPQGYVVAISSAQSRMMILRLPDAPAPDGQALPAVLTSGPAGASGRQGLVNTPVALAVTADGRILVLEQGTTGCPARIQAFDVNGNPVPSFDGAAVTSVPAAAAAGLDTGLVGVALRQAFAAAGAPLTGDWLVQAGTTVYRLAEGADAVTVTSGVADLAVSWTVTASGVVYDLALVPSSSGSSAGITVARAGKTLFTLRAALAADLNGGFTTGDVAAAFAANGVALVAPVSVTCPPLQLDPGVVADLAAGTVPAALAQALAARGRPLPATATVASSVTVTVHEPGQVWTIRDRRADTSYKITKPASGGLLDVVVHQPTMGLHDPPGSAVTYLGMSTETKGYVYVLSYAGDGSLVSDYRLDVYQPNGSWLARTTGLNAARIVVDVWRNVYSLNYESFGGPHGRTEPSVSVWTPST